jgi:hypothetical protein
LPRSSGKTAVVERPGYAAQHAVSTELQAMGARRRRAETQWQLSGDDDHDEHFGEAGQRSNGQRNGGSDRAARQRGSADAMPETSEAWARASLRSSFQGASLLSTSFGSNGF